MEKTSFCPLTGHLESLSLNTTGSALSQSQLCVWVCVGVCLCGVGVTSALIRLRWFSRWLMDHIIFNQASVSPNLQQEVISPSREFSLISLIKGNATSTRSGRNCETRSSSVSGNKRARCGPTQHQFESSFIIICVRFTLQQASET